MAETPHVTILIPVFNRAEFVCDAVDSALAQTYEAVDIIVVDNCSNDGTFEKLSKYSENSKVKIVRNRENVGRVENWNIALRHVKGDYFHFLMSDDMLTPDAIEKKVTAAVKYKDAVIISSGHKNYPSDSLYCHFNKEIFFDGITAYKSILNEGNWLAGLNNNMFSTYAMTVCGGFDTQLGWGADWNFYFAMMRRGNVIYVPEPLSIFREHVNRLSEKGLLQSLHEDWIVRKMAYMPLYYKGEPKRTLIRSKFNFTLLSLGFLRAETKSKHLSVSKQLFMLKELSGSVGTFWVVFSYVYDFLRGIIKEIAPKSAIKFFKKAIWGRSEN